MRAETMFERLGAPLTIRACTFRNRIFSSGHQTVLARQGMVTAAMIAYHEARARGGAALIVTEATSVHPTAYFNEYTPIAYEDRCIDGFRRLAEAVHAHDCRLVGQLFHPGAEVAGIMEDGSRPVPWAPSMHTQERYLVTARPMSVAMIGEVIDGYAASAARMIAAGFDGVEVLASHGYLPIQFCNPRVNHRTDAYGGSFENRLRFLDELHDAVRARIGGEPLLGLRISADDLAADGFSEPEVTEVLLALDRAGRFDYFNVTVGTSRTTEGAVHIVAPMSFDPAYVAPYAARLRAQLTRPILVTGRFNRPQEAERALREGQADMIGMTRAQICDPDMVSKTFDGHVDDVRVCIACNQACIGHYALGCPISCIQHPETGRELQYGTLASAAGSRDVVVVGGGPAGLKAASVAARRGHRVVLYEQATRLGGQVLLAQRLPYRAEFGGLVTNLEHEARAAGVEIRLGTVLDATGLRALDPEVAVIATGAVPHTPSAEIGDSAHVVDAWSVIRDEVTCGNRVVVADWRGDWVGIGIALKLVRAGHHVHLVTVANCAGVNLQYYTRDSMIAELHRLGVVFTHYARFCGADENTAYFLHASGGHPIEMQNTNTVVLCYGHESVMDLATGLEHWRGEVHWIGDALTPRTAEEAVLEGLKVGSML